MLGQRVNQRLGYWVIKGCSFDGKCGEIRAPFSNKGVIIPRVERLEIARFR